ncbi:hypothetical protein GPALN_011683 [Globodera pallida]|nr:hypothetical protein GPALN_011683 [Globodera pallida]
MSQNFVSLLRVTCDRKLARRTKKRLTTACKTAHARHKKVEAVIREQFGVNADDATAKMERRREKRRRLRRRKRMEEKEHKRRQEEAHGDDEDDPFDDEHCTVEQFEQEAERMRKKRMVDELDDDEREIRRLEAKLRKKKRGKGKNAPRDGHSSDDDDLERAILGSSSRSSD